MFPRPLAHVLHSLVNQSRGHLATSTLPAQEGDDAEIKEPMEAF